MSGSSPPRACAHVKESLARPIPGIADAGKNAVMKVVIGSGRMNGILRDWGILGQAGEVCNGAMRVKEGSNIRVLQTLNAPW